MQFGYPLVAWGTIEDISAAPWVSIGTPTVTPGQTDPFGGTGAVLINDTDAAVGQSRYRNFTVTLDGSPWVLVFLKAGTAAVTDIGWYDSTAAVFRCDFRFTWSGGVPAASIASGSGAVLPPVALGNGWYAALVSANGVVAANAQRIYLYPASNSASLTGSATFFWQSAVLLDALDEALSWAPPRDGSDWVRSDAGTADAWLTGQDYHLRATVCDIPDLPQSFPAIVSGWEGNHEIPCVNHGVERMLYVGAQKQTLRFVPDRSNCLQYIDSELVAPLTDPPVLQPNAWRRFVMELRNTTTRYPSIA